MSPMSPEVWPRPTRLVRESPNSGETILGFYEEGEDASCKVCFDPSGKDRPKEFKTAPGSGYVLHAWKRETK
jgi:hypothetical protein